MRGFLKQLFSSAKAKIGISIILAFVVLALFPQVFAHYSPTIPSGPDYQPPNLTHLLGTDYRGVDVLSEVIWGSRVSLIIGLSAAAFATSIGSLVGIVAGFKGGLIDEALMRISDISLSIPSLALMILVRRVSATKSRLYTLRNKYHDMAAYCKVGQVTGALIARQAFCGRR